MLITPPEVAVLTLNVVDVFAKFITGILGTITLLTIFSAVRTLADPPLTCPLIYPFAEPVYVEFLIVSFSFKVSTKSTNPMLVFAVKAVVLPLQPEFKFPGI